MKRGNPVNKMKVVSCDLITNPFQELNNFKRAIKNNLDEKRYRIGCTYHCPSTGL